MTRTGYIGLGVCLIIGIVSIVLLFPFPSAQSPNGTPIPKPPPSSSPDAAPILTNHPLGTPLKGSKPAIYLLMEDGQLRHINSWSTFVALGFSSDDIVSIPDEELQQYKLGPPMTRWLVTQNDPNIYQLDDGERLPLTSQEVIAQVSDNFTRLSFVSTDFLEHFPLRQHNKVVQNSVDKLPQPVQTTAVLWADGTLWVGDSSGVLSRWELQTDERTKFVVQEDSPISTLASHVGGIYIGTQATSNESGKLWELTFNAESLVLIQEPFQQIVDLAITHQAIWAIDNDMYDVEARQYRIGTGIVQLERNIPFTTKPLGLQQDVATHPLRNATSLAVASQADSLWIATRYSGLYRYSNTTGEWQNFNTLNSPLPTDLIHDVHVDSHDAVWLTTPNGVARYGDSIWALYPLAEGVTADGAYQLVIDANNRVWVAGDRYIAFSLEPDEQNHSDDLAGTKIQWQLYTNIAQPIFDDQFRFVVLDDADRPWFVGTRTLIHFDGEHWLAYSHQSGDIQAQAIPFNPEPTPPDEVTPPPVDFPSPHADYIDWLQWWPRPSQDNGRCMHFVQDLWVNVAEVQRQIARLQRLNARWILVNYANHYQLQRLAPLFADAGVMVIWRPFVRPYATYPDWQKDVNYLRTWGFPPYMQLYNEPSLEQEWDAPHSDTEYVIDQELYWHHLKPAIQQVYDAGGYVGLQFLDPEWLRATLQRLKADKLTHVANRLFFIPHAYGINHPPDYTEDINAVLGFREFATIFEQELGFVPIMIAGEGGWRIGDVQDNRYPPIDIKMHRDYHTEVFEWFRTGQLSDDTPLPDYLLAFCPWLIADPSDKAAWYDSPSGDKIETIEAVEALPDFTRDFSWMKE